jgi:hypothetical protein
MLFKKTLPALLLGLTLTAGCETLGLGGDDNKDSSDRTTRDDRISHDRGTARDRGGYDGTVMKYPADFDHGIPTGARLAREVDTDGSVIYKAAHDGKLYIYDVDAKRVIWSGFMRDGERLSMDTRDGRATIDGQSVLNRDLNPDHRYRLYFVPGTRDSFDSSDRSSDRLNDRNSDRYNDDLR